MYIYLEVTISSAIIILKLWLFQYDAKLLFRCMDLNKNL
jgi:hypothetical protein